MKKNNSLQKILKKLFLKSGYKMIDISEKSITKRLHAGIEIQNSLEASESIRGYKRRAAVFQKTIAPKICKEVSPAFVTESCGRGSLVNSKVTNGCAVSVHEKREL